MESFEHMTTSTMYKTLPGTKHNDNTPNKKSENFSAENFLKLILKILTL